MKRITATPEQRERAKANLLRVHGMAFAVSGETKVTSLGFSERPGDWLIRCKTRAGQPFAPGHRLCRTDLHITAILPPAWITADPAALLVDDGSGILIGSIQLDTPENVDSLELLCVAKQNDPQSITASSLWLLRFTSATVAATYPIDPLPRKLVPAIEAALPRFRKKVAAAVYQRLRPPSVTDARSKFPNDRKIEMRSRRVRTP